MLDSQSIIKNMEEEILILKRSLDASIQEMQKYKYIATTKIEEFISPSSNIQSDDISTYYASIVNALLDSKNIYTKIIDDLKKPQNYSKQQAPTTTRTMQYSPTKH
ncbi:MAG: hypothetical protein PHE67_10860 [Campylobacterales bacterium]|nr:hypothetical protein [Campylobacterales bacterium]